MMSLVIITLGAPEFLKFLKLAIGIFTVTEVKMSHSTGFRFTSLICPK